MLIFVYQLFPKLYTSPRYYHYSFPPT